MRRLRVIGHEIGRFYWGSGLCDDVPALAWTLVTTLVPLALGLGAVATVIFERGAVRNFAERAADVFPHQVHDQVVALVLETRRDSPALILLAVAAMLWTSSSAVGVIERCLARLLHRDRLGAVTRKLRHLGLAAGLVVIIALTVVAVTETTRLRHQFGLDELRLVGLPVIAAINVGICTLLYRLAPVGEAPWRAALAGAVPGGLVLFATPTAARYYLEGVAGGSAVGVFLVILGVLVTCWVAALGLIVGAGVTARVALGHPLPSAQPTA
jgi:uncharacterized BrkB/YihY/UPF0761 family membrane protein